MGDFKDVIDKINQMEANIRQRAPQVIAETATEHFKRSFRTKSWDGEAWPDAKNPPGHGSLMVRSGALLSSIRPTVVTQDEVRISAGGPKVPYAEIHNKGGTIEQVPTAKQKRFFWAMEIKNPSDQVGEVGKWGAMALARKLTINIPKRQYMGKSSLLNTEILGRISGLVRAPFKK